MVSDPETKALDSQLVARAQAGDDEAFRELVLLYERRVLNLAYSLTRYCARRVFEGLQKS